MNLHGTVENSDLQRIHLESEVKKNKKTMKVKASNIESILPLVPIGPIVPYTKKSRKQKIKILEEMPIINIEPLKEIPILQEKQHNKEKQQKQTRKRKVKILEDIPIINLEPVKEMPILQDKLQKQQKQTRKRKIKILDKSPIRFSPTQGQMVPAKMATVPVPPTVSIPQSKRWNEEFIDILEQLSVLMAKQGDQIRSRVYKKAQETIMSIPEDIIDINQLKGKPGIGETILAKLQEYINTGTLNILEREKNKPEYILSNIYGIGPKKASELVKMGIKSIADLRQRQDEVLNAVQKVGLKYYEDIEQRIPRSEIDEYNTIFDSVYQELRKTDPIMKYEIVGSYRRGAQTSGDIDVIITSSVPDTFKRFVDILLQQHIILEILSRGQSKCLVITKIPDKQFARRVDFLFTSPKEYPFSVLYFTGSKGFNTVMRGYALKLGYSLNEHGFSKMEGKHKSETLLDLPIYQERDIFTFLKLQYKEPKERIDGRSVIPINVFEEPVSPLPDTVAADLPVEVAADLPVEVANDLPVELQETSIILPKKKPKTEKIKVQKEPKEPRKSKAKTLKNNIKLSIDNPIQMLPEQVSETININESAEQNIRSFKTKGISLLESLAESDLNQMLIISNDKYYNETPLLTDNEYDILKEFIARKFPKNEIVDAVGAPIIGEGKNKVQLPFEMWSMDKIKPDSNALDSWKQKYHGPYILSCKLDGVSGMYVSAGVKGSTVPKLYTRGNGTVGQDISHLIQPMNLDKSTDNKGIVVRGEFILSKHIFQEKYKDKFANPRNMVAGLINKQSHDERIHDLKFVGYEVIEPPMSPSEQLRTIQSLGFDTVQYQSATKIDLTNEYLSSLLLDWRSHYEYEIDGIIVTDDHIHQRISSNPDHAFAFKMVISDQMAEAKVVDVLWEASKNGYLKPRVRIEPIRLGGVKIEYATGFNGKFIEENKIGIGAVIQIIRSGDVIPYIQSISVPAEIAKMPEQAYHWTNSHVDIILDDLDSDPKVLEKNITAFFVELEVDGLAKGNVKRLIDGGFNTVGKIIRMTKADFEQVGFKSLADKFVAGIRTKIDSASLPQIMRASNRLGRGISGKIIEQIMTTEPDILTRQESNETKVDRLTRIKGIGKIVAATFVEHIGEFIEFLRECGLENKLTRETIQPEVVQNMVPDMTHPLFGKKIVMTKVRDQEIIQKLADVGGQLVDSIGSDTFALIVKSKEDTSAKVKKAIEKGIPIMTPDEFKSQYM